MFNLGLSSSAQSALSRASATDRSHPVIEFTLDGTIFTVSNNFLDAICYTLGRSRADTKHVRRSG